MPPVICAPLRAAIMSAYDTICEVPVAGLSADMYQTTVYLYTNGQPADPLEFELIVQDSR